MKTNKFIILLLSFICLCMLSCSDDDATSTNDDTIDDDEEVVIDEDFTTNTKDTTFVNAVTIAYTDDAITITNPYESDGVSITESDGNVVITSTNTTTEINYVLSGSTTNGSLKIYSDYKFGLGFNGISIISTDGPALNIQSGKKVTITQVGGTSNRLVDSQTYTAYNDEDMKGAFFSEGQLNFEGSGSLQVLGRYKHAICSDDYIRVKSGSITVLGAASDAIHAKDYFRMDGGTLNLKASSDGIDCGEGYILIYAGDITIKSADDGIVASYEDTDTSIDSSITISGGTFNITTTGQKGAGIKSDIGAVSVTGGTFNIATLGEAGKAFNTGGNMTIGGGEFTLTTSGDAFYDTDDQDISSPAGIKCDGVLTINKGTINITSTGAGGKGISVDGDLVINDGEITVSTSGDMFKYGSDDTAAKAIKSDANVTVNGGTIVIKTTKEEAEGLESKDTLIINGGTIEIEAYDDCINASNHIEINGGNIYCYSTTNDGIDSNGTLTITGGVIISSGTTSPEEGIDCDNNTFKVTGGIIIGTGGATSSPTANYCTQRSVIYGTTGTADQFIHIEGSDGTSVLTYKTPRTYSQMTLLFSSPDLASNITYTIYKGGSVSGGSNFHGLYTGATYTKGSSATTFTPSSMVTTIGTSSGGQGGRP